MMKIPNQEFIDGRQSLIADIAELFSDEQNVAAGVTNGLDVLTSVSGLIAEYHVDSPDENTGEIQTTTYCEVPINIVAYGGVRNIVRVYSPAISQGARTLHADATEDELEAMSTHDEAEDEAALDELTRWAIREARFTQKEAESHLAYLFEEEGDLARRLAMWNAYTSV